VPHKPPSLPLISGYTKRRARPAVDHGTQMAPISISTTQAAGFDVLG
jgi:hypothetical protein